MKILVMGGQRRQIQQVVVTLVPGGIGDLCQQIARLALPVAEVEVDRAEVEAQTAHIAEQQHPSLWVGIATQLAHLLPHRLLEAPLTPLEIVMAVKREQPNPLHPEPAPLIELRQLVEIQSQHKKAVGEGVGPRRKTAMAHRALPDGAGDASQFVGTPMFGGYSGAVHSSAPKRLATSSALRTPSSWKPLYQ